MIVTMIVVVEVVGRNVERVSDRDALLSSPVEPPNLLTVIIETHGLRTISQSGLRNWTIYFIQFSKAEI